MPQAPRDIPAERADIDRLVAGKTVPSVFAEIAAQHADQEALKWPDGSGGWRALTWRAYREQVREATMGLLALGFAPGAFGVIMARNRPEHLIADLAIVHAGGRAVSIYNTLAPEQIAYIANHCEAAVAFVEDRAFLAQFLAIREQLPHLRRVVLMEGDPGVGDGWVTTWAELLERGRRAALAEPSAFDASWRALRPSDIVSLIYTSGTTGAPKGVTYTHDNVVWTCEASRRMYGFDPNGRFLSYLPLAHVAERFASHWSAMYIAGVTYLVPELTQLLPAMLASRPQVFVGVPRVWEKLQTGIQMALAGETDPQRKAFVEGAIATGREIVEAQRRGQEASPELAARAQAVEPILTMIRGRIGLDQCDHAFTSTAPTPPDVLSFFAAIGLPIAEIWGMSELTGPATGNPLDRIKIGTAGISYPGVELKLAEDGEILVRGGNVTSGYYRDPERTAELFDADGWLHSGDIAEVDDEGYYRIVDRKKELIITSSGKNISPANVEALLKHHPLIGQAIAVGDHHSYITALIVLDHEVAPAWARSHGLAATTPAALVGEPAIIAEVHRAVEEANSHLSRIEQVKRFTLLPGEWTAESEELTPTLKLRRRIVQRKYAREIEGMYAEPPTGHEVVARVSAPAVVMQEE